MPVRFPCSNSIGDGRTFKPLSAATKQQASGRQTVIRFLLCLAVVASTFSSERNAAFAQRADGATTVIAVNNGEAVANGDIFPAFSDPFLNNAGQVAFRGFSVGGGFNRAVIDGGVYIGDASGQLTEFVRFGDPGLTVGSVANSFGVEAINDSGVVAYSQGDISASDGNVVGSSFVLNDGTSPPIVVVRTGDRDADGDEIEFFQFADLDASSRLGLEFIHDRADSSVLFDPESGLRTLVKEEQPAPDGSGTVRGAFHPSVNNSGQTLYSPRLKRPGVRDERPSIFRETPGVGRELLFRSDDPSTSPTIDGTLLLEVYNPTMNDSGHVSFYGSVSGAADPANDGLGLFVIDEPSSISPVVREGEVVPNGDTFAGFGRPIINDAGDLAFYALLTDDPSAELPDRENVGIYRRNANGVTEIVRDNQPAPSGDGTIDLPRFNVNLNRAPQFGRRPVFNDAGQIVFLSDLSGTASGNEDAGIFLFDDSSGLTEVVRTGDSLLDSTVVDLGFTSLLSVESDEEFGFNDHGQIAYRFGLADGREGVALWTPNQMVLPNPLDCSGNGVVDADDLECMSASTVAATLEALAFPQGDFDFSGKVDFIDFLILSENFGKPVAGYTQGDADLTGVVDFVDFLVVSKNFGSTTAGQVPEPTTSGPFVLALLGLLCSRRQYAASRR